MKSLVRLLRSQFEVQWVVLQVVASIIHLFSDTFRPYIKDFYVKGIDSSDVACCKLHIITRLVDSSNFAGVLRELQACIRHCIDDVASAAVRALGQCAHLLPSVLPSCIAGLMQLVKTNANMNVLPECVVVIRALVASKPDDNYKLIRRLARMFCTLNSSAAKAAVIWMVGEYGQQAGINSMELLRLCARSFVSEISQTKLQILSFAAKLYAAMPQESRLLYKYIVSMAYADVAFDIRDRARMMQNILGSGEEGEDAKELSSFSMAIIGVNKIVPVVPPVHTVPATTFSLESLSFCIGKLTPGYAPPVPFPITAPDSSVRDVSSKTGAKSAAVPSLQAFYADKEKSSSEEGGSSSGDSSSEATSSSDSSSSSEDEHGSSSETSDDDTPAPRPAAAAPVRAPPPASSQQPAKSNGATFDKKGTSTLASLFAGLDVTTSAPGTAPVASAASESAAASGNLLMMSSSIQLPSLPTPSFNILHFAKSHGLHIDVSIPRSSSVYGREFHVVRLTLANHAQHPISSITIAALVPGNEDADGSGQRLLKTPAGISEL
jgi:AP-3 complex subunit beta